jgi:hypothetical protein
MAASKSKAKKPAKAAAADKPERATPTVTEQANRNAEIVAGKMRGLSWSQLAASYGITIRRCQQIFAEWREENPTLRHHDPIEIADDLLDGYTADIEELVLIAATSDQDAVRVGAINARMNARQRITELLQALGVLPNDLGEMRIQIDARITAQKVLAVLEPLGLPDGVIDDLIEALDSNATEIANRVAGELEPAAT